MAHKEETTTFLIRLPNDVLSWVEQEAARSLASRNSEIVRIVRQRMDAAEQPKKAG
jgi:Arc-like DNA binding domain